MDRKELIMSPEYVIGEIETGLYNSVGQVPEIAGISNRDSSRIRKGNFCEMGATINRLVLLCLQNGFVPVVNFVPVAEYIAEDERKAKEVGDGK